MSWYLIIIFLITYFICSINPAIEICKRRTGEDIRNVGSGEAETGNASKVLGRPLGFLVFIIDIVKVFLAYYVCIGIGKLFNQDIGINLMQVFMVGALIGQCYPIFYSLKGGNGVVSALVTIFILDKQTFYVCLIAGIVILLTTRLSALASIGGIVLFVILVLVMQPQYIISACIMAVIILFKHRNNISRIISGQEEKIF